MGGKAPHTRDNYHQLGDTTLPEDINNQRDTDQYPEGVLEASIKHKEKKDKRRGWRRRLKTLQLKDRWKLSPQTLENHDNNSDPKNYKSKVHERALTGSFSLIMKTFERI